jgi:hypothetical protein
MIQFAHRSFFIYPGYSVFICIANAFLLSQGKNVSVDPQRILFSHRLIMGITIHHTTFYEFSIHTLFPFPSFFLFVRQQPGMTWHSLSSRLHRYCLCLYVCHHHPYTTSTFLPLSSVHPSIQRGNTRLYVYVHTHFDEKHLFPSD